MWLPMTIVTFSDCGDMARPAAANAAKGIRRAICQRGRANIIVATGASQFGVLAALVAAKGIDWSKVVGFHLDEYLGLPMSHPASFRRYLKERLVDRVPLAAFHYVDGQCEPAGECRRLGELIRRHPIDVALVGIGENGHLAFNDPPADFQTEEPYIVVELDAACRRQQLGEGWFAALADVPTRAISMSIRQIMKSRTIVCSVPDRRKAEAVRAVVEGPVTPQTPASILQQHADATLYLDLPAASLLSASHMPLAD
jgi:glucosamine-6-phosphate deaminase